MPELPTLTDRLDAWPFFRADPTPVVLGVRPGATPSDLPPVRIFLGTEEAQYRAERIFFYSIEQVRDPGRVYEIHLMKNVTGFDRAKWRTGFTNYRYAIPAFAGGTGKAIYNDVDQIYLADPALLFDLDMGDHGYLAISAKDTSVMLIDCERMLPLWNRETAARLGKHALIDKPSATPGLWGQLDGHWNARDQEYVEGLTKCLHYTALHQQPWHPFPEAFSYHPNPLAYVWYDLERAADAEDYEAFTNETPSPDFAAAIGRNLPSGEPAPAPGDEAVALFAALDVQDVLDVRLGPDADTPAPLTQGRRTTVLRLGQATPWPEKAHDAVVASDLLGRVPPADLPWLLGRLFGAARKVVHLDAIANAPEGLGSAVWWRQRVDEIAARHPGVSWQLTVADKAAPIPGTVRHFPVRAVAHPEQATIWALIDGVPAHDAQVRRLAAALGGAAIEQKLDRPAIAFTAPWPDLVIAAGAKAASVARRIKGESQGATRIVQLGMPGAAFELFDLVIATPQLRLPVRDNVLQITAPLLPPTGEAAGSSGGTTALIGRGQKPFRLTAAAAARIGQALRDAGPGPKALRFEPDTPDEARDAVLAAAGEVEVIDPEKPLAEVMAKADRLLVTGDDPFTLTAACLTGKPVTLVELPYWYDGLPGSKPIKTALTLLIGGGTSYRGTPHQQHVLGRLVDRLIAKGWLSLPRDPARLHRALIARGLLVRADDPTPMAAPRPIDDLERVIERIRRMLTRAPQPG
ncbi:MAG: mitochondrial fission ELM1 family protein [Geminicoccaceae bacterium]|nr:mitochondrial fission ELM1 family protein [Geminicoccaceae bacterium]HRY23537.1 ELM1/GtrOC1 family putative glycosyltransferase [Geminicoccaceae bacterium]